MSINTGRAAFLGLWCLLMALLWIAIGGVIGAPHLFKLIKQHRITSGIVVKQIPNSHGKVVVRYAVNGAEYVQEFAPYSWSPGDSVDVFYLPDDPSVSEIWDPAERLRAEIPAAVGASILLSAPFIIALWHRGRDQRYSWPWRVRTDPRVTSTGMSIGALVGIVTSIFSGHFHWRQAAEDLFILAACICFLYATWVRKLGWRELLKSPLFWSAVLLAVAANLMYSD